MELDPQRDRGELDLKLVQHRELVAWPINLQSRDTQLDFDLRTDLSLEWIDLARRLGPWDWLRIDDTGAYDFDEVRPTSDDRGDIYSLFIAPEVRHEKQHTVSGGYLEFFLRRNHEIIVGSSAVEQALSERLKELRAYEQRVRPNRTTEITFGSEPFDRQLGRFAWRTTAESEYFMVRLRGSTLDPVFSMHDQHAGQEGANPGYPVFPQFSTLDLHAGQEGANPGYDVEPTYSVYNFPFDPVVVVKLDGSPIERPFQAVDLDMLRQITSIAKAWIEAKLAQ